MALSSHMFKALMPLLKPGMRIASFGYPDIIATPEEIKQFVSEELNYLETGVSVRHNVAYPVPEAVGFFKALGVELVVYDIIQERGCEIIADLNSDYLDTGHYDIVLDVGTLEHCFNIGRALMNMASAVKVGGYILNENPFNNGNHGFYGLNPTLYHDFYETNGFKLLQCSIVNKETNKPVPFTDRFQINGGECNFVAVARRNSYKAFEYPQQTKYKEK